MGKHWCWAGVDTIQDSKNECRLESKVEAQVILHFRNEPDKQLSALGKMHLEGSPERDKEEKGSGAS